MEEWQEESQMPNAVCQKTNNEKNLTLNTACLLLNMEVAVLCGEEQTNRGILEAATCE